MEYILLGLIGLIGVRSSYTDIKKRKIYNKDLLIASIVGNLIYLVNFNRTFNISYFVNISISIVISLLFYGFKIWAAGDAKLFSVIIFLLPYRFYREEALSVFPAFSILATIFSIAFIYVLGETVWLMIKKQEQISTINSTVNKDIKKWIWDAITGYSIILFLDQLIKWQWGLFYSQNMGLMIIVHLLLLMFIYQKIKRRQIMNVILITTIVGNIILSYLKILVLGKINLLYLIMVVIVLLLRVKGSQYNYERIPTSKVISGMILSYGTVMKFLPSRVKGLPQFTDETTKCRISEVEAEAIRRWEKSKYGEPFIVVVKHIPFAPFIVLGTFAYVVLYWV